MGNKSGFILINKPSGPTSHGIINRLRRITGIRKIGHAGTLDPFASGLLICAVGREATKEISKFVKLDKKYIAIMQLGAVSDTQDRTGIIKNAPPEADPASIFSKLREKCKKQNDNVKFKIEINNIKNVLIEFIGRQMQVPPMFSAKKINGKKLYELARKGVEIEREPAGIEIFDIKMIAYDWPRLEIEAHVSSGTYIRSLAHDIGKKLGCGAYLEELERTEIGKYKLRNAVVTEELDARNWHSHLFS
jgi:tRNA pseudouridine55 synthase